MLDLGGEQRDCHLLSPSGSPEVPLRSSIGLCETQDPLVCPARIPLCVVIGRTGVGLHVVPLTFHAHVHAHSTHWSRWSDSHVLLAVHDETPHRLAIWIVGSSLTYCTV